MFEPSMKTFYDTHGYLVVKNLFQKEELADVIHRTDEMIADPRPSTRRHLNWP